MFAFDGAAGSIVAASDQALPVPGADGSQKLSVVPLGKYMDMYRRTGAAAAAAVPVGASDSSHGNPSATAPPFSRTRREIGFCGPLIERLSIPAPSGAEGLVQHDAPD